MTSKEKILKASRQLFGQYGYGDTTFKKIADKSGVALGLITHHFGSKEKLFVLSSLCVLDEIGAAFEQRLDDRMSGIELVMEFARTYLDCSVDPNLDFLILVRCSPYSDLKSKINRDDITKKFEEFIHILAGCIDKGIEDKTVIDCDSVRVANVIFSTMVGSLRTRLLSPYCPDGFYDEVLAWIHRAVERK